MKPNANPPFKVRNISQIKARINPTLSCIRTYTCEIVEPKGSTEVQEEYNGQKTRGRIIVIDGNCSNVLRRDIVRKIKLNWNELFNTNQVRVYCRQCEIK